MRGLGYFLYASCCVTFNLEIHSVTEQRPSSFFLSEVQILSARAILAVRRPTLSQPGMAGRAVRSDVGSRQSPAVIVDKTRPQSRRERGGNIVIIRGHISRIVWSQQWTIIPGWLSYLNHCFISSDMECMLVCSAML